MENDKLFMTVKDEHGMECIVNKRAIAFMSGIVGKTIRVEFISGKVYDLQLSIEQVNDVRSILHGCAEISRT